MLFHTPTFLIFICIFIVGLYWFKGKQRIIYTCIASYIFYGWWHPPYVVLLFLLTLYAFYFAKITLTSRTARVVVILLGLIPLSVFKYTDFILQNLNEYTGIYIYFVPEWSLPIGISFITFTAISFVIESQRNRVPANSNLWHTSLFISFFPQLIAGPILRPNELLPQLTSINLSLTHLKFALLLFSIGVLKKVGIADQLAPYVDHIYSNSNTITPGDAWLVLYAFSIQIYADFSGYTDMALGIAALLGVQLPENFRSPYMSLSVREFWTRWHMTLSRWLKDYLYIPLGGSRGGILGTVMAVMTTMVLGGLWHGAAWTFLVWGALHGTIISIERNCGITQMPSTRFKWIKMIIVYHFVAFSWIFFRTPSFSRAIELIQSFAIPTNLNFLLSAPVIPIVIILTIAVHKFDTLQHVRALSCRLPSLVLFPLCIMAILICSALSVQNPKGFIYFNF